MKAVLVGPPNTGKSTVFNAIAGYKSVVSNFPGTTVKFMRSTVRLGGKSVEMVDLPGVYNLTAPYEIERSVLDYLIDEDPDVIVNILNASQLESGLPLTMELLDYHIPMVVVLNMTDEALRNGQKVNSDKLGQMLGVPVIETVATKHKGLPELVEAIRHAPKQNLVTDRGISYTAEIEAVIDELSAYIENMSIPEVLSTRYAAARLLEGESYELSKNGSIGTNGLSNTIQQMQHRLEKDKQLPVDTVLLRDRQQTAADLADQVIDETAVEARLLDRLDEWLLHPIWGYVVLFGVLVGLFYIAFGVGAMMEEPLLEGYHLLEQQLLGGLIPGTLWYVVIQSGLSGVGAGIAIVLPYLVPLLFLLTLLEDVGYLPRMAYLTDSFMNKVGLQGSAIMPAMLGYGCSVPAIMATRILNSTRDKIIAAVMSTLIPCSARSVVIMGLVGYYLGVPAALAIYGLNILVIAVTSRVLSALMPSEMPGMLMEVPPYRMPSLRSALQKVWYRVREFVTIAWPLLVAGSILLGIAQFYGLEKSINAALSPLTLLLGLPVATGITLIFGVLRKELSLIMLMQALGTHQIAAVLTSTQIMTFAIFVTFYLPCLATLVVLRKELGTRWAVTIAAITLIIALTLATSMRLIFT